MQFLHTFGEQAFGSAVTAGVLWTRGDADRRFLGLLACVFAVSSAVAFFLGSL